MCLAGVRGTAGRRADIRAGVLGIAALGLLAVYVRAYRMEPRMLRVRHHQLDRVAGRAVGTKDLRILHLTDIQTPTIGDHERRALEAGLAARPDLIVLTGDYVQNELGRLTEERAAFDLRVLMSRVGFTSTQRTRASRRRARGAGSPLGRGLLWARCFASECYFSCSFQNG